MKSNLLWAVLGASSVLASVPISSVKRVTNLPTVPNKFIVEVDSLSNIPSKRSASPHEALYDSLRKRAVRFKVDKEFNSQGLFVGAALTLNTAQDVAQLKDTPGVKAIRPVRTFARPNPVKVQVVKDPKDPAVPPDSESTHILTGVDRLHAQGITGSGVTIGIIDTGIDYTHPSLGGAFGPGHKVIGGFDLVGDAYTGTNTPVPDPDPLDQCAGHGTHVAGIIGADPGNPFGISGVAYNASIAAYRVFGCNGFVTDDVIVDALLRGVADGVDILTMSLGGADGWTESSSSVVSSRIAATGKIVTIAAGNDGASGAWYTSSPGNGINAISVASLDNTNILLQNLTVQGVQHNPITYQSTFPFPVLQTLPLIAISKDPTVVDDACNPLPDDSPDLTGFVVLVRRGSCTFVQKLTNLEAKGGTIALIYDNGSGFSAIDVGQFTATLIQAQDGVDLANALAGGANITVTFPQTDASTNFPDPNGGLISSFTSYGPSNDFFFKPAVAAPGGNILSTLPVNLGVFGIESGTSMATPFVAGSAALILSVKGKTPAVGRSLRTLLETTAQSVPSTHTDGDPLQTLTQQGAGLINVFDAIHTTTIVSPAELVLNDTAHFKGTQQFTVRNSGRSAKTYKLTHVPAGTAVTVQPNGLASEGPVPLSTDFASVVLSSSSFTLRPGQTQTITARFTPPAKADATTFPVFSGFIQIASGSDVTHVSYVGLKGTLKDKQVVDTSDEFFGVATPAIIDAGGNIQEGAHNYSFLVQDFPTLIFRLAFGSPLVRADLVDQNITFVPTIQSRAINPLSPSFTFPHPNKGGTFSQVKIIGTLAELDFIPRNNEDPNDNGFYSVTVPPAFANGTAIANGLYRFLFRALKVTGNPTNEADYESWLSPIVGFNQPGK
ncbi:hypothetical protein HGRIS_002782 [Hohenbuehelia grisea]|uniref:Subtilisin-like protease n=1 Tax=Hohenbuehelia grisea TaxID=104357 RepID=A0ABR3JNE8_9AGAR